MRFIGRLHAIGAMTVVPPSCHPCGEVIHWEEEGKLTEVSAALLSAQVGQLAAATLLAKYWPAKGSRHHAALALGGMLARAGRDRERAADLVRLIGGAAGDEEFEGRAENARTSFDRALAQEPVVGAPTLAGIMDERVVRRAAEWLGLKWQTTPRPAAATPTKGTAGLEFISIGELLDEPEEETRWLVEGRLPAGGISVIVAKPKVGKSTLARALALAVAQGEPWLGWETTPGTVFYLALEEKRDQVREHFRTMGATGNEPLRIFFGPAPQNVVALVEAAAREQQPALIIVDTLQRLVRAHDLNDYAVVIRALEPLLRIARETGAHVALVHHARKGGNTPDGDEVLGSTAITGTVDTTMLLRRSHRCRSLRTIQRCGEDLEDTVFELDEATQLPRLAGKQAEFEGGRIEAEILSALAQAAEPITEPELDGHVQVRTEQKRAALRRLVARGAVERLGKGARGDPFRYRVPAGGPGAAADSDARSLVPSPRREQGTRQSEASPPLEFSCSHVPLQGPEQGNKSRESPPDQTGSGTRGRDDDA